jgi:hypothetical protein
MPDCERPPFANDLAKMTVSSSSFEDLIASLPDVPEKEVIISELDGAVLPSPAAVVLLMRFTLR